jgi:hypothetical protein
MKAHDLSIAFSGAILLGYLVSMMFFRRFWRQTRERLFACFAWAFFFMAIERALLLWSGSEWGHEPHIYVTRLLAFLLIIWGIWEKNRAAREQ